MSSTVTVPLTELTVRDFVIRVHNVIQTVISLRLSIYRDTQHVVVIFVNYNSFILWLDIFHVVCKLQFSLLYLRGISTLYYVITSMSLIIAIENAVRIKLSNLTRYVYLLSYKCIVIIDKDKNFLFTREENNCTSFNSSR